VLVVMGVPLAFISAGTARRHAGLDGGADDAELGLRLARHNAAGGVAQFGAVKTQTNATDHVSDVLLSETRVGARSARGRAVDAVVNAAKKRLAIDAGWVWMRRDDLSNTHVDRFLSAADLEGRLRRIRYSPYPRTPITPTAKSTHAEGLPTSTPRTMKATNAMTSIQANRSMIAHSSRATVVTSFMLRPYSIA
jgi:hypothetical protein